MTDASDWRDWVKYAERDLASGVMLMTDDPRNAAWLFAQASEKHLKAALVSQGREPPRTHSLEQLLKILGSSGPPGTDLAEAEATLLDAVAVPNRYPGNLPELSPEQVEALSRAAAELQTYARLRLGMNP